MVVNTTIYIPNKFIRSLPVRYIISFLFFGKMILFYIFIKFMALYYKRHFFIRVRVKLVILVIIG